MTKAISIAQYLKQSIPKKNQLLVFLIVTSIIGVLLVIFAVHNTSKDLELIREVDNLHLLAKINLAVNKRADELAQAVASQSSETFQVWVVKNDSVIPLPDYIHHEEIPLDMANLEKSRINERGGYVEIDGQTYTWVKLSISQSNEHVVLAHKFNGMPTSILVGVYLKRLLVPGIFYVWLMVWVGLIIRHLTVKLIVQNKKLEQMALYDSLTGLPNRVLLNDRLHKLIQDCRRHQRTFALAVFDLNKFKAVNDTFGHDQGDELLSQLAERVRGQLRDSDTFSRIGGDEFVLILVDADEESSIRKCEHIQSLILKPYKLSEGQVSIGLSIGIALFPNHGEDLSVLMRNADMAMYRTKNKGGDIQMYAINESR